MATNTGWTSSTISGDVGNNQASNNSSGFSAPPSGYRSSGGTFEDIGNGGIWRSSTEEVTTNSWIRTIYFNNSGVNINTNIKNFGYAVRCVKGTGASLATLTTTTTSSMTQTTATSGGDVTDDGGATVTAKGVCWSTSPSPTTADSQTNDGTGTGPFASSITGLTENTIYYVRAYATNSVGTAYGNEVSFTSLAAPYITITSPTSTSNWQMGTSQNITWDYNITGDVIIILFKGATSLGAIVSPTPCDGSFTWDIPMNLVAGTDYII